MSNFCNVYYCIKKKEENPKPYVQQLLDYGFPETFGISYRQEEVRKGKYGKPLSTLEGIHFNISHGQYIVAIACANSPVGIDVESSRRVLEITMEKSCTEKERKWLDRAEDRGADFLRLWTLKESYVKMVGEGLRINPSNVEFIFKEGREGEIDCNKPGLFKQYFLEEGILSICIQDTETEWSNKDIKVRKMTF